MYEQKGPITGYLFRIAHNLVADNYRDKKGKQVNYLADGITGEIPAGDEVDPQARVERRAVIEELYQGLTKLSLLQQEIIRMRYLTGMEFSDMAVALNKTEGAIRTMLHRSLNKLGEILGDNGYQLIGEGLPPSFNRRPRSKRMG